MIRRQPIEPGSLSRRFDVAAVRNAPVTFTVTASDAEREALAADAGLQGVEAFSAVFDVAREGQEGFKVTGAVRARVRQICVVSLEPFQSLLEEPVSVVFRPEADVARMAAERAAQPMRHDDEAELDDLPDPIVDGRIDLGALAAEIMMLGLDPYPRKPGVVFAEPEPISAAEVVSPFAALRQLKADDAS